MRVRKTGGGVTESVFYDGQMPVETFEDVSGSNDVLTQNFLGARGIEIIETKVGSGSPTQAYPLYDIHGNMTSTLTVTGSGTGWTVGNERSYDVWGSVRSGATTGGPKGRYVANLGHVQDDESGLIYMRARYYEPGSGRFISEDPAMDGSNWNMYCKNNPVSSVDVDGMLGIPALIILGFFVMMATFFEVGEEYGRQMRAYGTITNPTRINANVFQGILEGGVAALAIAGAILGMADIAAGSKIIGALFLDLTIVMIALLYWLHFAGDDLIDRHFGTVP